MVDVVAKSEDGVTSLKIHYPFKKSLGTMGRLMRRFALILAIIATCFGALGQGKILFANDANHLFVLPSLGANEPLPVSPLPSGHTLLAVLYAGTSAGSMSLQKIVALDATGWLSAGRMVSKAVVLTGVPGAAVASFQVFITDTGAMLPGTIVGGYTYYFPGGTYFGTSGLFTATPGASLTYPTLVSGGPSASTWSPSPLVINGCLSCPPYWMHVSAFPLSATVSLGSDVTIRGGAYPYHPRGLLRFQWWKDGSPIVGATNRDLTLTNVTLNDSGSYWLNAHDDANSGGSDPATLTVFIPATAATLGSPTHTTNNQFQFTVTGTAGSNYIVQVATNLSATTEWISLFTNTSPFTFVDTNANNFPQRFYRAYAP